MHELALTEEICEIIAKSAQQEGLRRVERVSLVVGELSTALPEAIEFSFYAIIPNTSLEGARLDITVEPLSLDCRECGLTGFYCPPPKLVCPSCQSREIDIKAGQHLYIDFYEGE